MSGISVLEYDMEDLKKNIEDYFAKRIAREDLGKWAERAYYDLLKGGYVEQKKIVIYPFLQTVSRFHMEVNDKKDEYPCSEAEVKEIWDILCGYKNFSCRIRMSIPELVYKMGKDNSYFDSEKREVFCKVKALLDESVHFNRTVQSNQNENEEELFEQMGKILRMPLADETLLDLLQKDIVQISKAVFDMENRKVLPEKRLYACKSEVGWREDLIKYVECYIGIRDFSVLISYEKGLANVMII